MFMDAEQDSKREPEVMMFLRIIQDADPEIDLENMKMTQDMLGFPFFFLCNIRILR